MKGKLTLILTLVMTVLIWIGGYGIPRISYLDAAKLTALLGAVLISWEFILSTRSVVIEELFGGLDNVYKVHHWVGKYGFILVLLHPIMLAIKSFLASSNISIYFLPTGPVPYAMGVWAIYLFIILLIVTIFLKIEYHLWKFTHNLMGIPLLFVLIHVLIISSDVSRNPMLRVWIVSFVVLAIYSFVYKRFIYPYIKGYAFKIKSIQPLNEAWEIELQSDSKKKMDALPGQFVFTEMFSTSMTKEAHPFSIAGIHEGGISVLIKSLGDYTQKLQNLKIGDTVKVFGPHGRFYKHFNPKEYQIWIAGGIGIAPFLSVLEGYAKTGSELNASLFYIVKSASDMIHFNKLENYANTIKGFKLYPYDTSILGRIGASKIYTPETSSYIICASKGLTDALTEGLVKLGVKRNSVKTEQFTLY